MKTIHNQSNSVFSFAKKVFVLIFLLAFSSVFSQATISGKLLNQDKKPIEFAEIILLTPENIFFKNQLTNEQGLFEVVVPNGNYFLKINQSNVEVYSKEIVVLQNLDLGEIRIIEKVNLLNEVSITKKKKTIERQVDRLVFNVENAIGATGGDAVDALKLTPGIRVQNDKIAMIGKSGMAVMVDDRLIELSGDDLVNYLRTIPSDNIAKIEVITTPPAKYQAAGNSGLINIKLKKVKKDSWNSSVGSTITQRSFFGGTVQGDFNYNKDKLSLQSSLNIGNTVKTNTDENETFFLNETWSSKSPRKIDNKFVNLRAGIDYQLSSKWTTGIQYLSSFSKMNIGGNTLITRKNNSNNQVNSFVASENQSNDKPNLSSINLHATHVLDTIGSKINFDLDYFSYKNVDKINYSGNNLTNSSAIVPSTYFAGITSNNSDISNYSGKVDVELPKKWANLSFGGRISQSVTNNNVGFFNNESGIPVLDPLQSNAFEYTENNQALYISANKEINAKWTAQFGLRTEATQTKGFSKTLNQTNTLDYIKLFPTLYVSYKPNENNTLTANYSRRINRPNYEQLNPFKIYDSPFIIVEGNPFLRPSFSDNFELTYSHKNLENKLFFSNTTDGFQQLGIVDSSKNITNYFVLNFMNTQTYGVSESYTYDKLKWWTSTNAFDFTYSVSKSSTQITVPEAKGYLSNFSTNNDFTLNTNKTFFVSFNYNYSFPGTAELAKTTSSSALSISLKYLALDKKLQFTLTGNDIFRKERPVYSMFSNGILQTFNNYYDQQSVRLAVRYKFGNSKLKVDKRDFGNEDERNRTGK
jgi:outer membrane receptor protein involved in Fe transport